MMKNGLYSIHVTLQDGRSGKGSGVVMFRDGKIERSRCAALNSLLRWEYQ
jgi:hypothetical protein